MKYLQILKNVRYVTALVSSNASPTGLQLYDLHGVYPPPAYSDPPQPRRGGRRYTSQPHHPDPFFDFEANFSSIPGMRRHTSTRNAPHHHPEYNAFTDPFELFNSMFGDMHRQFNDPFDPFSPFTRAHRNPQEGSRGRARQDPYETPNMFNPGPTSFPFTGGFDPFGGMPNNGFTGSPPRESRDSRRGGGRVYRHESRTTVTRNGITQSTWKRIEEDVSPGFIYILIGSMNLIELRNFLSRGLHM